MITVGDSVANYRALLRKMVCLIADRAARLVLVNVAVHGHVLRLLCIILRTLRPTYMLTHNLGCRDMQNLNIDKFRSRLHVVDVLEHCLTAPQVQDLPAASDIMHHIQSRMEELTHVPASSAAETAVICTDLSGMSALAQDSCAQMVTVLRHLISLVRSGFSFRHKQALSMYCRVGYGSKSLLQRGAVFPIRCKAVYCNASLVMMQAINSQRAPALVLVANEDITVQESWRRFVEGAVDTVITLHPLPAGQLSEPNVEVAIRRPNRWGLAAGAAASAAAGSIEVEQNLFARATERGISFQYCS